MSKQFIDINLHIELDGGAISGRAVESGGSVRDFSGRIGLLGGIDSLIEAACGPDATPPPRTDARAQDQGEE